MYYSDKRSDSLADKHFPSIKYVSHTPLTAEEPCRYGFQNPGLAVGGQCLEHLDHRLTLLVSHPAHPIAKIGACIGERVGVGGGSRYGYRYE